jgi:hypothetical protein
MRLSLPSTPLLFREENPFTADPFPIPLKVELRNYIDRKGEALWV